MACENQKRATTSLFFTLMFVTQTTVSSAAEELTAPERPVVTFVELTDAEIEESQSQKQEGDEKAPANSIGTTAGTFDPLAGRDTGADNAGWVDVQDYGLSPTSRGISRAIRTWTKPYESKGISRKTDFTGSEVWVSYCAILGLDWNPNANMKFPGLSSATTGGASTPADFATAKGGQGGGGAGGDRSWSARGQISSFINKVPGALGHEVYHKDSTAQIGDGRVYGETMWLGSSLDASSPTTEASIADNQWHCIKHHAKLNTVKQSDGILETWIDDTLLFSRNDLNLSDNEVYRSVSFWLQLYHGGKPDTTGSEHSVFFTDFRFATHSKDVAPCGCR